MTPSSYRAWCGVIGRVLPKPAAVMREALSETLPVRIATGEIRAYLPVSSDEGMAAGSGTSLHDFAPAHMASDWPSLSHLATQLHILLQCKYRVAMYTWMGRGSVFTVSRCYQQARNWHLTGFCHPGEFVSLQHVFISGSRTFRQRITIHPQPFKPLGHWP